MRTTKQRAETPRRDMHPADVVALLRKRGWTLRRLSVHHGLHPATLGVANYRPYPHGEALIAEALGVSPQEIWPTRYAVREQRRARRSR